MDRSNSNTPELKPEHTSVLVSEVLESLAVKASDTVLDATLGGAGHFSHFLSALGSDGTVVGIDADPDGVERARVIYAEDKRTDKPVAHLVNDNFRNAKRVLDRLNVAHVDKALFDLGWSGYQIASPRGFSSRKTSLFS